MVPRKHFPQNILVILKRTQPVVKTNQLLQTDIWEFIAKIVSWYSENPYEITLSLDDCLTSPLGKSGVETRKRYQIVTKVKHHINMSYYSNIDKFYQCLMRIITLTLLSGSEWIHILKSNISFIPLRKTMSQIFC